MIYKYKNHKNQYNEVKQTNLHQFRLNLFIAFLIILSLFLILRLAYLQFDQYKRYATLSLKNQMNIAPIAPTRGIIVDRNNVLMANNIPVYVLEIIPERVKNLNVTLKTLQQLIPSISDDDIENFNKIRKQNRSYIPIPLKMKLSQEEVAVFASNQYLFPGISIKARLIRHYPLGEKAAHILGYVGRLNAKDLQSVDSVNYQATNFIGKFGIEKYYEPRLHGTVGFQQVETDVSGRTLRTISKQSPQSGEKLYLTIDSRLQISAFDALNNKRGAVVLIDVNNGEILAMASSPSFDPNELVNSITNKKYQQMISSQDKPLFNRAISGLYPPGSTIKPYIGLKALDENIITSNTKIYDPGWFSLPNTTHKYRDARRSGHGTVNLKRALTVSCNTYFYQLANRMGIYHIEDMLSHFGFGQLTKIDLTEDNQGILPGPDWKLHNKKSHWFSGDTLITAIGQGFLLASPMQLASATATLSKDGQRLRPHLLKQSIKDKGEIIINKPYEEYPVNLKNKENWNIIRDAMANVILSKEGTGFRYWQKTNYTIAAKTGTSQVYSGNQFKNKPNKDIPEHLRDHSLFIGYAPVDKPQVAIAVILENNWQASMVARKIMDAYFNINKSQTT